MTQPSLPSTGQPADPSGARLRRLQQRADTYLASGQIAAAVGALQSIVEAQPDHVPALLQLAELHLAQGQHGLGRELGLRALSGHLDSPRTALRLLRMLNSLSESGLLVEVARQLPPPMWDSAKSLAEVAQELSLIGAHELAREYAQAALARDPQHPPSLFMAATMDVFFGDLDRAAAAAQRCLQILPDDPSSHWLLSRMRRPGAEARIAHLEQCLQRCAPGEDEAWLAYALHNELHDQKAYDAAWQALLRGCRAKRSTLRYSQDDSDRLFAALQQWRADECGPGEGFVDPDLTPIFVIGLHRSGTTLAERIISGHSAVTAGGETYDLRAQLRRASGLHFAGELDLRIIEQRDRLDYRAIGQGYLRGMAWRARGARYLTDKLPSNYFNVGFIARALPQARFIHLRRDPIDVGLSSLRTLFSHACPYSYDQGEYVAHYRHYRQLMAHWRQLLPGRILDVDYSDLVNAPEASAERMAQFCGLGYEPAMVRIESRHDAVATASSVMMRDGIRKDRGRVWAAYEQQLQPMIQALAESD